MDINQWYTKLSKVMSGKRVGFNHANTFAQGKTAFLQGKIERIFNKDGFINLDVVWNNEKLTIPLEDVVYIGNPEG